MKDTSVNSGKLLNRQHFSTSRELDFFSRKELIAQTGHQVAEWPLVIAKELIDNALDACEEAGIAPEIDIAVTDDTITVSDNGLGIPQSVVESILDFTIRVSSREAYVSPCRGAQGNALKTIVAMPFALYGAGQVIIESQGVRHQITVSVDQVKQIPKVEHVKSQSNVPGTKITIVLSEKARLNVNDQNSRFLQNDDQDEEKARLILRSGKSRFLQFAENYCWINPHLTLSLKWDKDRFNIKASEPAWKKWIPSNPTDPHWYTCEELKRLIAANICHNPDRTVREFVSEFRGLSGTAKQKKVTESTGLLRAKLTELVADGELKSETVSKLLQSMQSETKAVKPMALGIIGADHLEERAQSVGGDPESFNYKKVVGVDDKGLPWIIETCFAYCPKEDRPRRIITGVNWSPGIINPFRQLGAAGESLDSILEQQRAGRHEPTVLVLHLTCPKVQYSDRGKSSVIIEE